MQIMVQLKALIVMVFLILIIGILDIKNLVSRHIVLQQNTLLLEHKISDAKEYLQQEKEKPIDDQLTHTGNRLNNIFDAIRESHLVMQSIQPTENQIALGEGSLTYNLLLQGDFNQVVSFFKNLEEYHVSYLINHFEFSAENNHWNFSIELRVFNHYFKSSRQKSSFVFDADRENWLDPFCYDYFRDITYSSTAVTDRVSIKQLKLVGYLQQKNQLSGIVLMPNGESITVLAGDRLGIEQADIMKITETELVLRVKNGEWILKNLSRSEVQSKPMPNSLDTADKLRYDSF
ncbi:MAG: pilus assembly protein PilP [Gammaproteobacteria bacterium]